MGFRIEGSGLRCFVRGLGLRGQGLEFAGFSVFGSGSREGGLQTFWGVYRLSEQPLLHPLFLPTRCQVIRLVFGFERVGSFELE